MEPSRQRKGVGQSRTSSRGFWLDSSKDHRCKPVQYQHLMLKKPWHCLMHILLRDGGVLNTLGHSKRRETREDACEGKTHGCWAVKPRTSGGCRRIFLRVFFDEPPSIRLKEQSTGRRSTSRKLHYFGMAIQHQHKSYDTANSHFKKMTIRQLRWGGYNRSDQIRSPKDSRCHGLFFLPNQNGLTCVIITQVRVRVRVRIRV